jgi:cation diffusion facilitator family transporter
MTPQNALRLSVAAALATIALKWGAWWATGSVAFLSEALDSIVNLAGASFALAMVSYARRPADSAHPYGYGKAEYFSSALEGALIMTAAAGIFVVVAERIEQPQPLESLGLGTGLAVAAATMNFVVARVLTRAGKVHRSLATEADGQHLMADVWMTVGVVAGVGAAGLTGWPWLDPAVALLVAVNLVREGWRLVSFSLRSLMDAAWPHEDIQRAKQALRSLEPEGGTFANLRTRRSGARRFAFVELYVHPEWSVERADALAATAERAASEHGVVLVVRVKPSDAGVPRTQSARQ